MTWLTCSHDEADVIIVNQVMSAARHIVCDNTDVFVILIHFYKTLNITIELFMIPPTRNVANIGATLTKYRDIVPHLLP